MDDLTRTRLQLAEIVIRAEGDDEFSERLAANPAAVLAEYDIPESAVDDVSDVFAQERRVVDDGGGDIPCIHTKGCNDFTCLSSKCRETCKITIKIEPPDS